MVAVPRLLTWHPDIAMTTDPALQRLMAHYQAMPPVATMGLRIAAFDGDSLQLRAPLARHYNDKGCAFGGSMVSLMTLAGWGLVHLRLERAGLDTDIYAADSTVRYRKPLFDELAAEAWLAGDESWEQIAAAIRDRGSARMFVSACIRMPDGGIAAECRLRYVAIARAAEAAVDAG